MSHLTKKRDPSVELLRIMACLIVIGVHIKLGNFVAGNIDRSRLLISCFLGDGVTIFWMVTGFFLFRQNSFIKVATRTIISIILPAFFVMVCSQLLAGWVSGERTLIDSLIHPKMDVRNLFGNIVQWSSGMTYGFHLWYVFQYVKNMLWFPLLLFVCREEKKAVFARRFMMLLCFADMALKDIQALSVVPLIGSVRFYSIIDPSIFQILLGYEIYTNFKSRITGNLRVRFGGLAIFLGGNVLRCAIQYFAFTADQKNDHFVFWNTVFGTVCAMGLVLFVLSFNFKREKPVSVIRFIASKTYYIYLVHVLVYTKLNSLGIRNKLLVALGGDQASWLAEYLFTAAYVLLVFTIAFVIATVWQTITGLASKGYRKIRERRAVLSEG